MSTPRPMIRFACLSLFLLLEGAFSLDYKAALTKTLIFYEAQRSGKLPPSQRVHWRGDSALKDGSDNGVDLSGGYYDAGDHVKFGLPLSYTISMLAWGVVEFGSKLKASGEYVHALEAIRWGTDYLIKVHPTPNVLYGQVGEGGSDHDCWMRPEDMTTSRTSFKIDEQHPGADLAGETAAAFAAASRVFRRVDPAYSVLLLTHAKQLFTFAVAHPGLYTNSIPQAGGFYSSSGYQDEVAWAAVWLHRVTNDTQYLQYLSEQGNPGGVRSVFSWDDKYVGVQTLVTRLVLRGNLENSGVWGQYKSQAEQFICSCLEKGNSNAKKSPNGMLWFNDWANLQYVTSASFIASAYSKYLKLMRASIQCPSGIATAADLNQLIKSQADYILGSNPSGQSYMVGFGKNYPVKVHHRGASIPSTLSVSCKGGFDYFNSNNANPNVLEGAIVGGPNTNDQFTDARSNYQQAEPGIATNAPFLGVLAHLV